MRRFDFNRSWRGSRSGGALGFRHLNGDNLIFANERDTKVGFDAEHVLFVTDDGADNFLTVFERDLFSACREEW